MLKYVQLGDAICMKILCSFSVSVTLHLNLELWHMKLGNFTTHSSLAKKMVVMGLVSKCKSTYFPMMSMFVVRPHIHPKLEIWIWLYFCSCYCELGHSAMTCTKHSLLATYVHSDGIYIIMSNANLKLCSSMTHSYYFILS